MSVTPIDKPPNGERTFKHRCSGFQNFMFSVGTYGKDCYAGRYQYSRMRFCIKFVFALQFEWGKVETVARLDNLQHFSCFDAKTF